MGTPVTWGHQGERGDMEVGGGYEATREMWDGDTGDTDTGRRDPNSILRERHQTYHGDAGQGDVPNISWVSPGKSPDPPPIFVSVPSPPRRVRGGAQAGEEGEASLRADEEGTLRPLQRLLRVRRHQHRRDLQGPFPQQQRPGTSHERRRPRTRSRTLVPISRRGLARPLLSDLGGCRGLAWSSLVSQQVLHDRP